MSATQSISLVVRLPLPPMSISGMMQWARELQQAIDAFYTTLAVRIEAMIDADVTASIPTADGSRRFFFDTTKKVVYFDDGSWQGPHLEVIATADLPAAGATQDGRVIIENAGAGDRNIIVYAEGQRFRLDGGAAF